MEQTNKLALGSLFDGSGGFPLGGLLAGIQPVQASEVEPFPIRVTTKRLPFMKHYGDVTKMHGGEVEPVDIITFGSPCQDMSVAEEIQPTLVAKGPGAVIRSEAEYTVRRLTPTECARLQGFPDWWCGNLGMENPSYGEVDFWTDVFETHRKIMGTSSKPKTQRQILKWLKDPYSDAAEYKMWGNGIALPCVYFILCGIVWYAHNEDK